jgi:hypothetical protein
MDRECLEAGWRSRGASVEIVALVSGEVTAVVILGVGLGGTLSGLTGTEGRRPAHANVA